MAIILDYPDTVTIDGKIAGLSINKVVKAGDTLFIPLTGPKIGIDWQGRTLSLSLRPLAGTASASSTCELIDPTNLNATYGWKANTNLTAVSLYSEDSITNKYIAAIKIDAVGGDCVVGGGV